MRWLEEQLAKRWPPLALIALVTALVWGHTVAFEFVWDDQQFIQELRSIRSLKNVPEMFCSLEAQSSYPEGFKLFRPLRTVLYAVLYQLPGKAEPQPWIYHLANVLWHAGAAMLFYVVAVRLFEKWSSARTEARPRLFALLTALAFAVHPVVSEVVCWAKSLDDAMAAVFTLAAANSLLKWNTERQPVAPALIWFALAVYSKISAVPFAAGAFLIFALFHRLPLRASCWKTSGFALVAAAFMVHRHFVIGQSSQTAPISGTYGQTIVDTLPAAMGYLRLLFGLPPFHIDYSFMPGQNGFLAPAVLGGLALVLATAALIALTWKKADWRCVAFGLSWIGLFLLPVSNVLPMMQYMAERFLYLPLLGALLGLGALLMRSSRPQRAVVFYALIVTAWAALAWNRSWIWKDEVTLFVKSSQPGEKIQRIEDNAVAAIFKLPHVREVFHFDKSTRQARVTQAPSPQQGVVVAATLEQAHKLFPDDATVSTALGILYGQSGRANDAVPCFQAAVGRQPANPLYLANLGRALVEAKLWDRAGNILGRALTLDPANVEAWRSVSSLRWQQSDFAAALGALEKLKQLEPANPEHDHWIREARARLRPAGVETN